MTQRDEGEGPCCKVGKAINEFNLSPKGGVDYGDYNQYLVDKWVGRFDGEERGSRELAHEINRNILKTIYEEKGFREESRTKTHINIDYEHLNGLRDDGVGKDETFAALRTEGIDPEWIIKQFVSKSTILRHFKNCLDVTKETAAKNDEWVYEQIEHGEEQGVESILEGLSALDNKGLLNGGANADIQVDITVSCPVDGCSTTRRLDKVLDEGTVCHDHFDPAKEPPLEPSQSLSHGIVPRFASG